MTTKMKVIIPKEKEVISKRSLWDLIKYFLKLSSLGFGGPIALTNYMHNDLIVEKKWFSEEEFTEGLALCQLAPGPLAAQLAIYFGWAHSGVWGATIIGLAFILPAFLIVLAISFFYVSFQNNQWVQSLFYGIGGSVIAIIVFSAFKLIKRTIKNDYFLMAVATINGLVTAISEQEILWMFLGSGLVAMLFKLTLSKSPKNFSFFYLLSSSQASDPLTLPELGKLTTFFAKSGAFVFGSGLAIVPFLYSGVVNDFKWLSEQQFLDAVAIAMISPGPVVITVAFIGFLKGGVLGSFSASIATFFPCYLFTVIPAPFFRKLNQKKWIHEFVNGVTSAAIGAIGGAAYVLGKRAIVDTTSIIIAVVVLIGLFRFKNIQTPIWILLSGLVGLALK